MSNKFASLILCLLSLGWAPQGSADGNEIKLADLPDAVRKAAIDNMEANQIGKISRLDDNGHVQYRVEADSSESGKSLVSRVLWIAENGKLMRMAQEVPYFTLSYQQMQTIENRYPGIRVKELEEVDTRYYQVQAENNGQPLRFKFYEDGRMEEIPAASAAP